MKPHLDRFVRRCGAKAVLSTLAMLVPTAGSIAADATTDAMQAAYAPYRTVLFKTNGSSQPEAQQAITQAQQAWAAFRQRVGAAAAVPYDRDAHFAATLAQVTAVYDQAAAEIARGQLPQAHETLEQVRDLLAALRQRNGVVVFSDAMNAYHAAMEHLLIDGPKLLDGASGAPGLMRVVAHAGVLDHLARQLRGQAPAEVARQPEFDTLLKEVEASAAAVMQAALAQDVAGLKDAVSKLKKPYSRLFVKFG